MKKQRSTQTKKLIPSHNELTPQEIVELCARVANDKKALNVKALNISGVTSFTDHFLVCSATSEVHGRAIADGIEEALKKKEVSKISREGYENAKWILLDFGSVVVHIFHDYIRDIYNLEGFWHEISRLKK